MSDPTLDIRPATVADVRPIAAVVNDYAERGLMLHRSHAELYESVRDYQVAVLDGRVVGAVGLRIMWANLAEVYGLAVSPEARGRRIGRKLVEAAVGDAERLEVRRLFSLTYERSFFEKLGFEVVDRHQHLPLKVWSECVRCPKNQNCDEIAMLRTLEHVPDHGGGQPADTAAPMDEVPVLSETTLRIDASARR